MEEKIDLKKLARKNHCGSKERIVIMKKRFGPRKERFQKDSPDPEGPTRERCENTVIDEIKIMRFS